MMTPSDGSFTTPWYRTAFGRSYLTVYRKRDEDDARRLGRFLSDIGWACRGLSVLDIGCGPGRHMRVLGDAGGDVFGIDLSPELLAEAGRRGLGGRMARADMRALPFRDGVFDLALSLFTTFGYFETDEEHASVLAETRRVLKSRGRLLIDTLNPGRLRLTLAPETRREVGSLTVFETRWIDEARNRILKRVEIVDRAKPETPPECWTESVRLWTSDALRGLAARTGFEVVRVAGGFDGRAFSAEESERLILLCEARG